MELDAWGDTWNQKEHVIYDDISVISCNLRANIKFADGIDWYRASAGEVKRAIGDEVIRFGIARRVSFKFGGDAISQP